MQCITNPASTAGFPRHRRRCQPGTRCIDPRDTDVSIVLRAAGSRLIPDVDAGAVGNACRYLDWRVADRYVAADDSVRGGSADEDAIGIADCRVFFDEIAV